MKYDSFPWEAIMHWHHTHGRHTLPWRDYSITPIQTLIYRVWISEIFLQQTQAERVIPFFEKVMARFPDIQTLSHTDYDTFFPYYQGMGYYSRARNILKTSVLIVEKYQGEFPKEKSLLKSLPGIGEYTSSAILAFGYGMPFLTWDTNLEKIFSRYYFGSKDHKLSNAEKMSIEISFRDFIDTQPRDQQKNTVRTINNGLMDIARLIPDKNPDTIDWEHYPIQ